MSTLTLRLEAYEREARALIHAAQSLADERTHVEVDPLHLLFVLLDRSPVVQQAVRRTGLDPTDVLVEAELWIRKRATVPGVQSYLGTRMLDVLARAESEAARTGRAVSVRELVIASAQEPVGPVKEVMRATGLSAPILREMLDGVSPVATPVFVAPVNTPSSAADTATRTMPGVSSGAQPSTPARTNAKPGEMDPLSAYGIDLVKKARDGALDPVIGRDDELRRITQVLARRRENNPLLVGEPGIGKTAIVEALATRIANADVPDLLRDRVLLTLDIGALVAGAKLRGQLEERMRAVLDAVRARAGEVILFVPDLGAFMGQASAAGDLLAAYLGRGEVRVIAVATPDRMRKFLEEHEALSRRFVPIAIDPPSVDETIAILRGIASRFEEVHAVTIRDAALVSATHLGRRYVQGIALPKAAIDIIDEACARVRVEREGVPAALDALSRRIVSLEIEARALTDETSADAARQRERIEADLAAIRPKEAALRASYHEAQAKHAKSPVPAVVDAEHVAEVVATWTGVPVAKMLEAETEKLLRMEESLRTRVVGQEPAVTALAKAVRRGRVGLRDAKRPIGSFLFLGPSGVGKTELAKALAEFLFDDESALTRIDMSEFMEKHNVARLLGSPPGYVDSDAGGFLTEAVRKRPYGVVLFDELEKAHPDVFDILLQVLDDGRLTDSRGRLATFSETVILMTSNVGSHLVLDHDGDPASLRDKIRGALEGRFRPEFLNRIDDVVIFDALTKETLLGVANIQLRALEKLLSQRGVGLTVSDTAKNRIVELGYDPAYGARPLKRVILRELQDPLADALLRGRFPSGSVVAVDFVNDRFSFEARP